MSTFHCNNVVVVGKDMTQRTASNKHSDQLKNLARKRQDLFLSMGNWLFACFGFHMLYDKNCPLIICCFHCICLRDYSIYEPIIVISLAQADQKNIIDT
jgi:hypothetical protein